MRLNRFFHYTITVLLSMLLWKLIIDVILVIARGEEKSLVITTVVIGALSFAWYQLVKRL